MNTDSAILVPIVVGTTLLALGTLLYFLLIRPWRNARPLRSAFRILEENREAAFPEAAALLGRALTAGLRRSAVSEARFALAYTHARMERLDEAATVLADLAATGSRDRAVLYLDVWVRVRREKYEEAAALYDEVGEELGDVLQARLLASIAYLKLGRTALKKREADRALQFFQRVRDLAVLADKVPRDATDHQIVLGIEAIFDHSFGQAEERFTAALQAAERDGGSTLYPHLGLLLCEWRRTEWPGPDFDRRLDEQVAVAEAEAPAEEGEMDPASPRETLLRDLLVWHAVAALMSSHHLPSGEGIPQDLWDELRTRLDKVREHGPEMGDPDLLDGLVTYYFANREDQRTRGVELLESALEKGVNVPEVVLLVERERKLAEAAEKGVEHFLAMVKRYLGERSVPVRLRRELQEILSRNDRFRQLAEIDLERGDGETAPSLDDLHGRADLIHRRVAQILSPHLSQRDSAEAAEVTRLLDDLAGAKTSLSHTAKELERSEHELMLLTGEFLLKEEDQGGGEDAVGVQGEREG